MSTGWKPTPADQYGAIADSSGRNGRNAIIKAAEEIVAANTSGNADPYEVVGVQTWLSKMVKDPALGKNTQQSIQDLLRQLPTAKLPEDPEEARQEAIEDFENWKKESGLDKGVEKVYDYSTNKDYNEKYKFVSSMKLSGEKNVAYKAYWTTLQDKMKEMKADVYFTGKQYADVLASDQFKIDKSWITERMSDNQKGTMKDRDGTVITEGERDWAWENEFKGSSDFYQFWNYLLGTGRSKYNGVNNGGDGESIPMQAWALYVGLPGALIVAGLIYFKKF